ncbi:LOW QUALITY PROTEIN: hypothetical protein NC651_037885 [Populus alba x Populus x berolinensis]|nr:LOW QUALITY PROTEIN: hypothetical protein NC651_037885 [Populus alba x Populus x berolinensis]
MMHYLCKSKVTAWKRYMLLLLSINCLIQWNFPESFETFTANEDSDRFSCVIDRSICCNDNNRENIRLKWESVAGNGRVSDGDFRLEVLIMAFKPYFQRGHRANCINIEDIQLNTNWEDVICPICLDFPHNCVLLQCSSYHKGCRPFVCDTDHLHSNCLDRFKNASGMPSLSTSDSTPLTNTQPTVVDNNCKLACPLCRGEVTGWVVVDRARLDLDEKKRCCAEEQCTFTGTYFELHEHAQVEHPHARPSKIDPARQLDWENFQQSSEIIDVLSTIHSEVPRGVVLGDYVIEYGDDDTGDEFEDFPRVKGNWWTSCILYKVFDNFRNSRNRRRARVVDTRRGSRRSSYDTSNSDEGSVASVDFAEYRLDETDDEFASSSVPARGTGIQMHKQQISGNSGCAFTDLHAHLTLSWVVLFLCAPEDFEQGYDRFEVLLTLHPSHNLCLLFLYLTDFEDTTPASLTVRYGLAHGSSFDNEFPCIVGSSGLSASEAKDRKQNASDSADNFGFIRSSSCCIYLLDGHEFLYLPFPGMFETPLKRAHYRSSTSNLNSALFTSALGYSWYWNYLGFWLGSMFELRKLKDQTFLTTVCPLVK